MDIKDIVIRECKEQDLRDLCSLFFLKSFHNKKDELDSFFLSTKSSYERFLKNKDVKIFNAFYKEKLVGTIQVNIIYNPFTSGLAYVTQAEVLEDYRRQGIGTMLLEKAKEYGRNSSVYTLELSCGKEFREALTFYKKNGMDSSSNNHYIFYLE